MKIEIKKLSKPVLVSDGYMWSCELWIDGAKAAHVYDRGDGAPINFDFVNREQERKFDEYVASLPIKPPETTDEKTLFPNGIKPDRDSVIAELADHAAVLKVIARKCKKMTVFRLKSYKEGEINTIKQPFSPAVKEYLVKRFGAELDKIYNEDLS